MEILLSFVTEISKCLLVPIKHHVSYLVFYGRKVDSLSNELEKLEQRRAIVQRDVNQVDQRGDIIHDEVQQWLKKVDNMKSEVRGVMYKLANTKGSCWSPVLCYQLGKEATKKRISVGQLEREGEFKNVAHSPPPPRTQSLFLNKDFQAFASTEVYMSEVLKTLKDDEINIIGVHGMGGVGKTTLMKEVAKKAEQEKLFHKVVIVTVSQNPNINKIQEDIKEFLGLKFDDRNQSIRATKILMGLKKVEKLLVILDDLWEKLELSGMGIPYGNEHKGCKIVMTSRSSKVCNMMKSQTNIEVKPLLEQESWDLFKANAGEVVNFNELSGIARKVVEECKGLPLAIKVLGLALRNEKNVVAWNAVLERLKCSIPKDIPGMETEVFPSIKYSFDCLASEEIKLCFLFCCLFPKDVDISVESITWYMIGEGHLREFNETLDKAERQVSFLIGNLKGSGLLMETYTSDLFRMHDIVRDVAIWIASKETYGFCSKPRVGLKEWPTNKIMKECQRLSLMDNDIAVLPEEPLPFPNLHTLLLRNKFRLERIPDNFFLGMKSLRVVDLTETRISSLPTSLTSLTNLRVLNLSFCVALQNLSGIGALRNLKVLDLRVNESLNEIPTELGELSNLRYLNLSFASCRIPSNMICRLSRLEVLHVYAGFEEWQPQGSQDTSRAAFAELACLPCLTTLFVRVGNESCFWQDLDKGAFQQLKRFQIVGPSISLSDERATLPRGVLPEWVSMLARRASSQEIIMTSPSP